MRDMNSSIDVRAAGLASERMCNIVEYVESVGGPVSTREIAEAIGAPYKSVGVAVRRCVKQGWLSYPERGMYAPKPERPTVGLLGYVQLKEVDDA